MSATRLLAYCVTRGVRARPCTALHAVACPVACRRVPDACSAHTHPFRAQAPRALGANIWRQSHNPYAPGLYGVLDALGTMCWDENRDYGARYMGGAYAAAMRDMVKRDRNHPVRAPTRSHGL